MSESISFDRAADFYDDTRALPPHIAAALTGAILRELSAAGADHLLEVGAGTGRISYPLAKRGVRVTAADISGAMLRRFRDKLQPPDAACDFLLADATRLPFADGSFRAVLLVHVLHLIPDWRQAMRELRRVLAPGGVVLRQGERNDFDSRPEHRESAAAWDEILARLGHTKRERAGLDDTREYAGELGAEVRSLSIGEATETRSEQSWLESLRKRLHSNMWEIADAIYWKGVDEYEAWARARFTDIAEERELRVEYLLDVWRFP
jgi:ubiquinone/menaquinone biosynthesis C-methylase UbiE